MSDDSTDRDAPGESPERDGSDDSSERNTSDDTFSRERPADPLEPNDPGDTPTQAAEESAPSGGDSDADAPLSDLARRVSDRRGERSQSSVDDGSATSDEGGSSGDPFETMSVAEIDEETLWSSLEDPDDPTTKVGVGEPAEPISESEPNAREYVVSKEEYCERCPYLSEPPELSCDHEGTRIVEVDDVEHFCVRNCPMVEK
ncbi:hypothetical protein [Halobellus sp. GM3]|uniref:hypothetical protein n=1 Tax=Halobellus sp. GM3 TaxID=3458410 RepID=UPI00403DA75F